MFLDVERGLLVEAWLFLDVERGLLVEAWLFLDLEICFLVICRPINMFYVCF